MNREKDFMAEALHPTRQRYVQVIEFGGDMAICEHSDGPVLITKEQAMKFFNLTESLNNKTD